MATVQKIKPARTYPVVNAVHAIRAKINQGSPNALIGEFSLKIGTPYHIGTIPKGSFVLPSAKHVLTAFNGTTPALDMGTATAANAFMPTASIAPGATGFAGLVQGTGMGYVAEDTPVYVALTSGAGNTVGIADLVLLFYPSQD
jgi:hypothetical protein